VLWVKVFSEPMLLGILANGILHDELRLSVDEVETLFAKSLISDAKVLF